MTRSPASSVNVSGTHGSHNKGLSPTSPQPATTATSTSSASKDHQCASSSKRELCSAYFHNASLMFCSFQFPLVP